VEVSAFHYLLYPASDPKPLSCAPFSHIIPELIHSLFISVSAEANYNAELTALYLVNQLRRVHNKASQHLTENGFLWNRFHLNFKR
jgi:hypothetical protein